MACPGPRSQADLQTTLLQAVLTRLSDGGYFATFAYLQGTILPAGMRFHKRLHEAFGEVRRSPHRVAQFAARLCLPVPESCNASALSSHHDMLFPAGRCGRRCHGVYC